MIGEFNDTEPTMPKQPYQISCGAIWGGIESVTLDTSTKDQC